MHYDINDPYFEEFKVSLNGDIRKDIIEANDKEGWAIVEIQIPTVFGLTKPWPKRLYGRVFICRYVGCNDTDEESEPEDGLIEEPTYD